MSTAREVLRCEYSQTELPKFRWFADRIAELAIHNCRILDVGFGQAPNPYLDGDVTGLELTDVPKPVNYTRIVAWDLNALPLPFDDEKFDVVILGDVIEHVKRPFELLAECSRILRYDGRLIISTPNPHYIHEVLKTWLGVYHPDDPEHLVHFPSANLRQYVESLGLRVETLAFFKFWIPFVKWCWLRVGLPPALAYQYFVIAVKCRMVREVRG